MTRGRSLAATLAVAFGVTLLAVFALAGSYLYVALERQVRTQDNLDIVLAARHARRLAEELDTQTGIREHGDRLTSTVLGNEAMSMTVFGANGQRLLEHNAAATFVARRASDDADDAEPASGAKDLSGSGAAGDANGPTRLAALPPLVRIPAAARITETAIGEWTARNDAPIRGVLTEVRLRDGESASVLIARNMTDRKVLFDGYRDTLKTAGVAAALLAGVLSYLLIRAALRPLRDIAASAALVTVARLDTRIGAAQVPRELTALVSALNAMLDRVEQGFQRLSRFTADLAHDMRTPLGNMRGATEVALARQRSADEYETVLASNLEECDRLSRMIESVLFLARAEHPQFVSHRRAFDAAAELTHIADYFEGIADDAQVTVRVSGAAFVTADLELFRRAVSNLLANAIRYTPRNGEIVLDASASAGDVRIAVSNQGHPIPADELERIFDRFYRVDPSRSTLPSAGLSQRSTGSTGLGLAIVRTVMELHGGTAHAESDARGTRFILRFPRHS